jgi:two-component system phosphate regulon sensor histidine kinase PhoR
MDPQSQGFLILLVVIEAIQLFVFWGFIRYRYGLSLFQLRRLTDELAAGRRPKSFYIDGPQLVSRVTQNLEKIGTRLEEIQRQQQEEDFNLNVLLANMVEGVMVVDQRHVIRLVNDELVNLFSLKQSPLGRTVLESLREARVEMIVRETILGGQSLQREVTLESTAATMRHVVISAVPIRAKDREIRGAVAVFHDITRLKQLEVVRQEFVSNVSHELRTPLAIFRGYLETFADNPDLSREEAKPMIEAMRRHSNRLNALVEDLLSLTRLESGQVKADYSAIKLEAFFRQLVRDWEKRMDPTAVEFEIHAPEALPPVEVDALRFEQVMLNLLENAVAYSNPPRKIILAASVEGDEAEVRITDNGIGIPPADLPHVFERFYRVDKGRSRASGGTGLGLSIVKQIIQSHRGTVRAESEVGKGTTVVIRLPLTQENPSS